MNRKILGNKSDAVSNYFHFNIVTNQAVFFMLKRTRVKNTSIFNVTY